MVPVLADLHYLTHWPTHGGYNFVSGPLADITLITAFIGDALPLSAEAQLPRPRLLAHVVAPSSGPRPPRVQKHYPDGHGLPAHSAPRVR